MSPALYDGLKNEKDDDVWRRVRRDDECLGRALEASSKYYEAIESYDKAKEIRLHAGFSEDSYTVKNINRAINRIKALTDQ